MDDDNDCAIQTIAQKIINSCSLSITKQNKSSTTNRNAAIASRKRSTVIGKNHLLMSKRSELLLKVNGVVKHSHVSTKSSPFYELLKNLNLPHHWI